jgi:glycosyltransferase involved in cell wall biosynthesis
MQIPDHNLPLVSICIPTYNGAEYLSETLESIFAQSYQNFEIIISDDNSQDETIKIAQQYQKKSPVNFTIFEHEQYGIGRNWNFAIVKSRGKYIKFIFQDDLMLPKCVEEMVKLAEKDDHIGLVFSSREVFLAHGAEKDQGCIQVHQHGQDVHTFWSNLQQIQWGTELLSDPQFFISPLNKIGEPSNVLIKKSVFDGIGLFDEELHQTLDMDMWFRIMCNYKIGFCEPRLVRFRVHPNQASRKNLGLKNALDNQMLRAKMLYSSEYKIANRNIETLFRSRTQQLMQSELHETFKMLEQLQHSVPEQLFNQKKMELANVNDKLSKAEKYIKVKLGLREQQFNELEQHHEIEFDLTVKEAWQAYRHHNLKKMTDLLEKSKIFTSLCSTEILLKWLESFTNLASKHEEEFNVYSLINSNSWSTFVQEYVGF